MGLFKKKTVKLTAQQQKWNKMWKLWAEEKADSPYAELMTYHSEINNGGHCQYFENFENADDIQKEMSRLVHLSSKSRQQKGLRFKDSLVRF